MTVFVTGAYGHGNAGDDLLGYVVASELRAMGHDVSVCAAEINADFADRNQSRKDLWRELSRSDSVLLGGGGLFNDKWATDYYKFFASLAAMTVTRGASFAAAGVGIEPFSRSWTPTALRAVIKLSRRFGVRDPESMRLASSWAPDKVVLGVDLGWLALRRIDTTPAEPSATSPVVCVTIAGESEAALASRTELLEVTLKRLVSEIPNVQLRFVAMQTSRDRVHDDVSALTELALRVGATNQPVVVPSTLAETIEAFRGSAVTIGYRLHGSLMAYLMGAEVIAISRSRKVSSTFASAPGASVIEEVSVTADEIFTELSRSLFQSSELGARVDFARKMQCAARAHLEVVAGSL